MWIEIDEELFHVENIGLQYTIINSVTITFEVDLKQYNEYYDFFIHKHECRTKFIMYTNQFICNGCLIKILNIDFQNKISVTIICDSVENNISKIRDNTIDKILNKDK